MNNKITHFREAINKGKNPYIEGLSSNYYPAAESRFLDKAKTFANRFWILGSEYSFSDHSADELAYIWQIYLMKVAFDLK